MSFHMKIASTIIQFYPSTPLKCLNISFNPKCFRANIISYSTRSKTILYFTRDRMMMTTTKTKNSSFWITWKNAQILIVPNELFRKLNVVWLMLYLISFELIKGIVLQEALDEGDTKNYFDTKNYILL